jgi:hypothetical protein
MNSRKELILEKMRANSQTAPNHSMDIRPSAVCLEGSWMTTCYHSRRKILEFAPQNISDYQTRGKYLDTMDEVPESISLETWDRLEMEELRRNLSPPRVFVPRVNAHGIICIYEGIQYYLRFRFILMEKDKSDDRPLVHFLDLAGIETSFFDDGRIRFDFRRLDQSGLMFKKGKKNTPVPGMILAVKPVRRNNWEMYQA